LLAMTAMLVQQGHFEQSLMPNKSSGIDQAIFRTWPPEAALSCLFMAASPLTCAVFF